MANREYKDSFFRFIFNRPPAACSLYRAASQNPAVTEQDIRINTLDSILMDRIKNDVSLLVPGHYVVLLGHQSTWSLNLPLRCLWYISELYRHMIPNKKAMYRTKLIRIPAPQFYVFYIGSPKEPDSVTDTAPCHQIATLCCRQLATLRVIEHISVPKANPHCLR